MLGAKELFKAALRVALARVWKRGCSCVGGVKNSISFGEHKNATKILVPNPPTHSVIILGDDKHVEGFLEDLGKIDGNNSL